MRNVVLHSDSSFKRQPLENLFLFCKREFCSFFCLTMQHHSNWSKERSVIDYPSHAIKKRTITKEQLQNERTNKRSKEKRKKQTNKQTNFNSRKTKKRPSSYKLKEEYSRGRGLGESQEEGRSRGVSGRWNWHTNFPHISAPTKPFLRWKLTFCFVCLWLAFVPGAVFLL